MNNSAVLRICVALLLVSTTLHGQTGSAKTEAIYIGVLDDAREEMVNWKPGVALQRVIRPLFEKTGDTWKQVDPSTLPSRLDWTIAFDGKKLGSVQSEKDPDEGLTSVQKILAASAAIPSVGSPSQRFAGIMAYGPARVRRPLIAVSKAYYGDPDGWKREALPNEVAALVRKAFRRDYPKVDRCKDEEAVEKNWNFPDGALDFPAVYGSNHHSFLVETHLNAGDCGWVDSPDDPESNPWFFISDEGTVRRIGSFMSLLDAGDYDNNGKSEVVFFLSQGENTDGFVLFDADFKNQVSLLWSYH